MLVLPHVQWEVVAGSSNCCRPKGTKPQPPAAPAGSASAGRATAVAKGPVTPGKALSVDGCSVPGLVIKTRHHFSSKLQRMSTVARTQVVTLGPLMFECVRAAAAASAVATGYGSLGPYCSYHRTFDGVPCMADRVLYGACRGSPRFWPFFR